MKKIDQAAQYGSLVTRLCSLVAEILRVEASLYELDSESFGEALDVISEEVEKHLPEDLLPQPEPLTAEQIEFWKNYER